jgi:hypothetical protein
MLCSDVQNYNSGLRPHKQAIVIIMKEICNNVKLDRVGLAQQFWRLA